MQAYSTLTAKGQITLPKVVRETLKLKAGDTISYVSTDRGVMIVPRNRPVESIFGILETHAIANTSLADYDDAVRGGVVENVSDSNPAKSADNTA